MGCSTRRRLPAPERGTARTSAVETSVCSLASVKLPASCVAAKASSAARLPLPGLCTGCSATFTDSGAAAAGASSPPRASPLLLSRPIRSLAGSCGVELGVYALPAVRAGGADPRSVQRIVAVPDAAAPREVEERASVRASPAFESRPEAMADVAPARPSSIKSCASSSASCAAPCAAALIPRKRPSASASDSSASSATTCGPGGATCVRAGAIAAAAAAEAFSRALLLSGTTS